MHLRSPFRSSWGHRSRTCGWRTGREPRRSSLSLVDFADAMRIQLVPVWSNSPITRQHLSDFRCGALGKQSATVDFMSAILGASSTSL